MKITDEMIEAGAYKFLQECMPLMGEVFEPEKFEEMKTSEKVRYEDLKRVLRSAFEAALQTKLTEQDKLLAVMGEALKWQIEATEQAINNKHNCEFVIETAMKITAESKELLDKGNLYWLWSKAWQAAQAQLQAENERLRLINDEMIERGAIAIANAAGSMITEFKGQSADFTELRRKQSKACLEAALQHNEE